MRPLPHPPADGLAPGRRPLLAASLALPLALAAGRPAAAQPGVDAPPLPQLPRPLQLPPLHEATLPNGLAVVVVPRPGLPLVSLTVALRAGPEADAPGRGGSAELLAAMRPRGAQRGGRLVPAPVLVQQAEALGSSLGSRSQWGASTLQMTVSTPRAEAALALLADVLRRPVLADEELQRARNQALDALRLSLNSPAELTGLLLRRSFWGDAPHGRVSAPAALQRCTVADLQALQATWARPDLAALVLVGDISPAAGEALARRWLADWALPPAPAPVRPGSAPRPTTAPLLLLDLPGAGQSGVGLAAPFVPADDPDRAAALVANAVLGGDYSARLNQQIRIRRGLSYGVFSTAEAFAGGGMLAARCQTSHANLAQVLVLMRDELAGMATRPPGADELAVRQAALVGAFTRRWETGASIGSLVVQQWSAGRPLAQLARHVPQILAVTPEQVQALARRLWPPEAVRAVVVGDVAAAGPALAAQGEGAQRLAFAELDLEQPSLRRG